MSTRYTRYSLRTEEGNRRKPVEFSRVYGDLFDCLLNAGKAAEKHVPQDRERKDIGIEVIGILSNDIYLAKDSLIRYSIAYIANTGVPLGDVELNLEFDMIRDN